MIAVTPIATVKNEIEDIEYNEWNLLISEIELSQSFAAAHLNGIEEFELLEILFLMHKHGKFYINENSNFQSGVFSHRKGSRPNNIGVSVVKLIRKREKSLIVQGLDAISGSPVLDIKPFYENQIPR